MLSHPTELVHELTNEGTRIVNTEIKDGLNWPTWFGSSFLQSYLLFPLF